MKTWRLLIINILSTVAKVDAVFTTVVLLAETRDHCGLEDRLVSIIFLGISVVVGWIMMVGYFVCAMVILQKTDEDRQCHAIISFFILITAAIFFPAYLLADNEKPLDCVFGCDSFAFNQTDIGNDTLNSSEIISDLIAPLNSTRMCNAKDSHGVRLSFMLLALITVPISALLSLWPIRERKAATSKAL